MLSPARWSPQRLDCGAAAVVALRNRRLAGSSPAQWCCCVSGSEARKKVAHFQSSKGANEMRSSLARRKILQWSHYDWCYYNENNMSVEGIDDAFEQSASNEELNQLK